jgi:hypothetical protein
MITSFGYWSDPRLAAILKEDSEKLAENNHGLKAQKNQNYPQKLCRFI